MKIKFTGIFWGIMVLIVAFLYFSFDARKGGFPPCPFHWLTGWYCPGCGSQRALSALLHGSIFEALHYNVVMIVFLPLLIYSAIINFRHTGSQKIKLWYSPFFVKIALTVILGFWIFRNIPVLPFSLLAPLK